MPVEADRPGVPRAAVGRALGCWAYALLTAARSIVAWPAVIASTVLVITIPLLLPIALAIAASERALLPLIGRYARDRHRRWRGQGERWWRLRWSEAATRDDLRYAGAWLVTSLVAWAVPALLVGGVIFARQAVIGPWQWALLAVGLVTLSGVISWPVAEGQGWLASRLLGGRDLDAEVGELRESRTRLAAAFEAERIRIERDLHDGAQQQLLALGLTIGLAREAAGPERDLLLDRAADEAALASDQLRTLVRGIRPRVLDDHGLGAALAEIAGRSGDTVALDIAPVRFDPAAESCAYFVAMEALTNATRHAGATRVMITITERDRDLVLTVVDDGHGGAVVRPGGGLQGLIDRAAVHDGSIAIDSAAGGPTTLSLLIPGALRQSDEAVG